MDYRREVLQFIKNLAEKDIAFKKEVLQLLEVNEMKNPESNKLYEMLNDLTKEELKNFIKTSGITGNVKVNSKSRKEEIINCIIRDAEYNNALEKIPDILEGYKKERDLLVKIDILSEVIKNKNGLIDKLRELSFEDLKRIIDKNKFTANKTISKEKSKEKLIQYIVIEAERQMKSASII